MCRMLIAIGNNLPISTLLRNLKSMAQDKTIKHEHNSKSKKTFLHPDDWGISYLKHNKWITKKTTKPIFKDQKINKYFSPFKPQSQTDTEQLLYAILSQEHKTHNFLQSIQHLHKQ